ncbi:MAG: hypothetical protein ACTSRZ_01730 [Promethearchaeota archaeon]
MAHSWHISIIWNEFLYNLYLKLKKNKEKINFIAFSIIEIAAPILFLVGMLIGTTKSTTTGNIAYYRDFFNSFPILYKNKDGDFVKVVYLPYFYWIFYPFSFFDNQKIYFIFSTINFISIILILRISLKLDKTFSWLTHILIFIMFYHLGKWANIETTFTMFFYCTYFLFLQHKRKYPNFLPRPKGGPGFQAFCSIKENIQTI